MKKYLFIYGSLKRGFSLSFLLKGAKFISEGHIRGPYKLYFHEGGYPCLISGSFQKSKISGEIFLITCKNMLQEIDRVEGHPFEYKRDKVALYSSHLGENTALIGETYIYQSHEDLQLNHFIPSGNFLESEIPKDIIHRKRTHKNGISSQILTTLDAD